MNIVFYSFSKRKNSTKVPTSGGTTYDCQIKSPCSMLNPVIELALTTAPNWNYCYIQAWNRYYWVTDKTFDSGIWYITCKVDALASGKSDILGTTAHVLYSSSNYDLDAMDTRIVAFADMERSNLEQAFVTIPASLASVNNGTFVLKTLASGMGSTGVTTTYFLNNAQMRAFANKLQNPNIIDQLKQMINNPFDAIIECYYLPIINSSLSTWIDIQSASVYCSDLDMEVSAYSASVSDMSVKTQTASIPINWKYHDFRDLNPYTNWTLYVPFCGAKNIDPTMFYGLDTLYLDYGIDISTGDLQAILYRSDHVVVEEFNSNVKITLPLGQTQSRLGYTASGAMGAIATGIGLAMGGTAGVAATVGGVATMGSSIFAPTQIKTMGGFSGSILGASLGNADLRWQKIRITRTCQELSATPEEMRPIMGNALYKTISLSNLTGYVQTQAASVAGSWTDAELTEINAALDSGIYIE